jgi:hypothetical protein
MIRIWNLHLAGYDISRVSSSLASSVHLQSKEQLRRPDVARTVERGHEVVLKQYDFWACLPNCPQLFLSLWELAQRVLGYPPAQK